MGTLYLPGSVCILTPEEIVGTMTACGVDGYTSYGMNGLDDGGVLNRMEDDFLDSLRRGNTWCAEVIPKGEKVNTKRSQYFFHLRCQIMNRLMWKIMRSAGWICWGGMKYAVILGIRRMSSAIMIFRE